MVSCRCPALRRRYFLDRSGNRVFRQNLAASEAGPDQPPPYDHRIEQIANGDLVGTATADAVRTAQQAAQAAVMTAIIASTVINTTTHC